LQNALHQREENQQKLPAGFFAQRRVQKKLFIQKAF
jgi:hypothetical protein